MIRCSSFGLHFPSTYGTGADVRRSPRTDATFSDAYSMVPRPIVCLTSNATNTASTGTKR
jgi:hypothetical protein